MSTRTSIEWTRADDGTPGRTWNPVTGCTKVSAGCEHCYAESIARRFAGTKAFPDGFALTLRPERLSDPYRWRAPSRVFVNSMSDLFHRDVPDEYIARVFAVMARTPRHTYQILTKRHARMRALLGDDGRALLNATRDEDTARALYARWPLPNVHLGVSVENRHWAETRIPALLETPAAIRFISAEPLLGPIDLRNLLNVRNGALIDALGGDVKTHKGEVYSCAPAVLDWVIAGAESGPGARPMDPDWVRSLRDQCTGAGVAFFYKQDADRRGRKIPTPELDGRRWTQMPRSVAHGRAS